MTYIESMNTCSPTYDGGDDLVQWLRRWVVDRPEAIPFRFLVDGEQHQATLTYAELDRKARGIAGHLQSQNLAGERALLLYQPGLDFITGLFGCFYAGVTAVPVYPPRRNRNMSRVQSIAQNAQAKAALTAGDVLDRLDWLSDESPFLKSLTWIATDRIHEQSHENWAPIDSDPERLAVLQYTSGSTGIPKGVMLTHLNIMHNCELIAHAFEVREDTISMSWLPAYHDMGLIGGILTSCLKGQRTILMSPMSFLQKPIRWLDAITQFRVTVSGGPNFAYDLCSKKVSDEQLAGLDLSSWQVAYNGAEPVRASTLDRFRQKFGQRGFRAKTFYPCYGMAESTLIITGGSLSEQAPEQAFDANELAARCVQAVPSNSLEGRILVGNGKRLPGEEVLIVDPQTCEPLSSDRIGEIWVCSPSVSKGYFNNPSATAQTFQARLQGYQGDTLFLRTGDLGFFYDGELFVTGRLKDLIIIRGVNHYPQDIELTVERSSERVRSGAAAAFAVEQNGEEILVVVCEVERLAVNDWNAIIGNIRRNVSAHHSLAPDVVILVRSGSIPKTSSGKIQRHACRDQFLEGSLVCLAKYYAEKPPESPEHNSQFQSARSIATSYRSNGNGADHASTHGATTNGQHAKQTKQDAVLSVVYEKVRLVARERAGELAPSTNIVELGLDSLERVEIANLIADHFRVDFPDEVLIEIETCQQVADAVQKNFIPAAHVRERQLGANIQYRIDDVPEYKRLKASMEMLADNDVPNPFFRSHDGVARDTTLIDGQRLINFCSYNYLGMSGDPTVSNAAAKAIEQYGTSVSASRLVSGERPIHRQLEQEIADFIGVDDALVFVGGHATNETTIGRIVGNGDLIIHDSLAHNSILQGAMLSGAERRSFPHNDWQALDEMLVNIRDNYQRVLVTIEGTYSMDGDLPDLASFVAVKNKHHAFLMVDEAHSLGTLGKTGRGISEHAGVPATDVDVWMGTLSKSLGSCGGYIAGQKGLIELLKFTAPGFVYSVGLSPPNAAAALASLRLLKKEPERVATCQARSELFLHLAREHGLNTGTSEKTPIVPVILGNSQLALRLSAALFRRGINVQPILYPAVEERAARLRFFVTSCHSEAQIRETIDTVASELAFLTHARDSAIPTPKANRRDSASGRPI